MTTKRFKFNRSGELACDPRHAQVLFHRNGQTYLGDVRDHYRDEDETFRLVVTYFNGEPWPIDPPAALVTVLDRSTPSHYEQAITGIDPKKTAKLVQALKTHS